MRGDRASARSGAGASDAAAMREEWRCGMAAMQEARGGAATFAGGVGRHGALGATPAVRDAQRLATATWSQRHTCVGVPAVRATLRMRPASAVVVVMALAAAAGAGL